MSSPRAGQSSEQHSAITETGSHGHFTVIYLPASLYTTGCPTTEPLSGSYTASRLIKSNLECFELNLELSQSFNRIFDIEIVI